MRKAINKAFKWYYSQRIKQIQDYMQHPVAVQNTVMLKLLQSSRHTEWGRKYDFRSIRTYEQFAERFPVQDYESLKPFIERMMMGEKDVLWNGQTKYFSKSSGTTSDKSKYIPVSSQSLKKCHIKGTWDTMTLLYHQRPDSKCFENRSLLMGGSLTAYEPYPKTTRGDISAIMIDHMPWIARPFFTPDFEVALMDNFEEKIDKMADATIMHADDMCMIGGVPTWTVVLLRKILEKTGADNMSEVWPNIQAYVHGGVSFTPYRNQFEQYFPSSHISYQEIYNATEGYFAIQNDFESDDMLLLLNNGVFYEFLPLGEWDKEHPKAVQLGDVELGQDYAMVISTNAGLWRYKLGDTVKFTSKAPYKIKISGRTAQYVNAFGEEVMVHNTDKAVAVTCQQTGAIVSDYTVAPVYFNGTGKGGHEWLVEFEQAPNSIIDFRNLLDRNLQSINSDYEAKRYKNMALNKLQLKVLPNNTFHRWLKAKGKYGGQNKVPRLANHRNHVEEILSFLEGEKADWRVG